MQAPSWQRDYNNLLQVTAENISVTGGIAVEEAKKQFANIYNDLYLAPRLNCKQQKKPHTLVQQDVLKKPLKNIIQKLGNGHPVKKAFTAVLNQRHRRMSNSAVGGSAYYKELKPIIEFLAQLPEILSKNEEYSRIKSEQ